MSLESYDGTCPGCRPAMFDIKTGLRLPETSPEMQVVNQLFDKLTLFEREAWHRFTCQNSESPMDIEVVSRFQSQIHDALAALASGERPAERGKGNE